MIELKFEFLIGVYMKTPSLRHDLAAAVSLAVVLMAGASAANASSTTLIYINSSGGALYSYDSANSYAESLIANSTGAFSISSGPAANTIYIQGGGGALSTYDLIGNSQSSGVGSVPGNALGEGRDGFLYAGSGVGLYKVNPNTGVSAFIGNGTYGYAGDLAVDPTDLTAMYGAVSDTSGVLLVKVNKNTGGQTLVGSFGLGASSSIFGLGFSLDGILFAAGPTTAGGEIYTVNKLSGVATGVHELTYQPFDMATQPFEVVEPTVPEPATLILAGLGLAGMALGRRKKA